MQAESFHPPHSSSYPITRSCRCLRITHFTRKILFKVKMIVIKARQWCTKICRTTWIKVIIIIKLGLSICKLNYVILTIYKFPMDYFLSSCCRLCMWILLRRSAIIVFRERFWMVSFNLQVNCPKFGKLFPFSVLSTCDCLYWCVGRISVHTSETMGPSSFYVSCILSV